MSETANNPDNKDDRQSYYRTTFRDEITYEIRKYVSYSFLVNIISAIADRLDISSDSITVNFNIADSADIEVKGIESMKSVMEDSKNYNRQITGIRIDSGIKYDGSDTRDHKILSFTITPHFYNGNDLTRSDLRAYGVSNSKKTSQNILDWGNGTLSDFRDMRILEQRPTNKEMTLNLETGLIEEWSDDQIIQQVEVINQPKDRWINKQNIIAISSIVVAIIIAVITWSYFTK